MREDADKELRANEIWSQAIDLVLLAAKAYDTARANSRQVSKETALSLMPQYHEESAKEARGEPNQLEQLKEEYDEVARSNAALGAKNRYAQLYGMEI
jgi:hypothetical protein